MYTLECRRCFQLIAKIANDKKIMFLLSNIFMQVFANKEANFH